MRTKVGPSMHKCYRAVAGPQKGRPFFVEPLDWLGNWSYQTPFPVSVLIPGTGLWNHSDIGRCFRGDIPHRIGRTTTRK